MSKRKKRKRLVELDEQMHVDYVFEIKDGRLKDEFKIHEIEEKRKEILKRNLMVLKSVDETEKSFIIKIGNRIKFEISKETLEITGDFKKLSNIEIKTISQGNLSLEQELPLNDKKISTEYIPTSDFHTHLETALSSRGLMFLAMQDTMFKKEKKDGNGEKDDQIFFTEKFLNINGIYCSNYDENDFSISLNGMRLIRKKCLEEKYNEDYKKLEESCKPIYYPVNSTKKYSKNSLEDILGRKMDLSEYTDDEIQKENGKIKIKLSALMKKDNKIFQELLRALSIRIANQETFSELTTAITLRQPICNEENFPQFLRLLAYEYKQNNIDYVELSASSILNGDPEKDFPNDKIAQLITLVPEIEKEFGVKMRFLASFDRNENNEKGRTDKKFEVLKKIVKMQEEQKKQIVVGFDYMGFEKSENNEEFLKKLVDYVINENPEFIIRIHAGENSYPMENVSKTLKCIKKCLESKSKGTLERHITKLNVSSKIIKKEEGKKRNKPRIFRIKQKLPRIRIGHAVYLNAYDEIKSAETLRLMKELNAVVEINLSSNYSLNNISSMDENPIKKYFDNEIPVVLCTDGHGMYSATLTQEVAHSIWAGLTKGDIDKIRITEEGLKTGSIWENRHVYLTPKPYTIGQKGLKNNSVLIEALVNKFKTIGLLPEKDKKSIKTSDNLVKELDDRVKKDFNNKIPILITGASKAFWGEKLDDSQKENIKVLMKVLVDVLNSEKAYLVTGGTNFGVEKYAHLYNNERTKKLDVLGIFPLEEVLSNPEVFGENTITHAMIMRAPKASWKDLFPEKNVSIAKELNGELIAISGGNVVEEIIQKAHNEDLGNHLHLMAKVPGASGKKSKQLLGNQYEFETPEQLIVSIAKNNPRVIDWKRLLGLEKVETVNSEILEALKEKVEQLAIKAREDIRNSNKVVEKEKRVVIEMSQIGEVAESMPKSTLDSAQREFQNNSKGEKNDEINK